MGHHVGCLRVIFWSKGCYPRGVFVLRNYRRVRVEKRLIRIQRWIDLKVVLIWLYSQGRINDWLCWLWACILWHVSSIQPKRTLEKLKKNGMTYCIYVFATRSPLREEKPRSIVKAAWSAEWLLIGILIWIWRYMIIIKGMKSWCKKERSRHKPTIWSILISD